MQTISKNLSRLGGRASLILLLFLLSAFAQQFATRLSQTLRAAALFPWAAVLTVLALRRREIRPCAAFGWAVGCLVAYVLSGALTGSIGASWLYGFCLLALCMLFLLPVPVSIRPEKIHRELTALAGMFVALYMPFAILAVISVFTGHVIRLPGLKYPVGIQWEGFVDTRICIFMHANKTARFTLFNILFCAYGLCRMKRLPARLFFGVNLLLNVMVLAHTKSRTAYILLAIIAAAIALHGILCLKSRLRIPVAVAAAALAFVLVLSGINALYEADVSISRSTVDEVTLLYDGQSRADTDGQFDMLSNGRGQIWSSAARHLLSDPKLLVTGMGPGSLVKQIEGIPEDIAHLHNSFLAALAHYGLPYLICLLGLLCTLVPPCLRLILLPARRENRGAFIAAIFVGAMLMMAVPEEMLFTVDCFDNLLFFLFCGYVLRLQEGLQFPVWRTQP